MKVQKMDDSFRQKLREFLTCGKFDVIDRSVLNQDMAKSMMYPTNDFHLYEDQLSAVKAMLPPSEELYLLQMGFGDGFFAADQEIIICNGDLTQEEYDGIRMNSISVIAPSSWTWVVLIDEAFEGGLGIFVSSRALVEKFNSIYQRGASDVEAFVNYFTCVLGRKTDYMREVLELIKE